MAATQARRAAMFAAFVCFFATLPIYSPNIVAFNAAGVPQVTTWFAQGVLGFALLSSALTGLEGTLRRRRPTRRGATGTAAAQPAGLKQCGPAIGALYFAGVAGYIFLLSFGPDASDFAINAAGLLFSACCGLALTPLCVRWAEAFSHEDLARLVVFCAAGIAAAALLNLAVCALPAPLSFIVHAALLAIGSYGPFAASRAARSTHQPSEDPTAPAPKPSDKQAKAFISVMGTPLVGIALSSFVIGITPTTVFGGIVDTQVIGSIAAGVIVGPACMLSRRHSVPTSSFVQRLLIPVAAAAALALCTLPWIGPDLQSIVSYTLFSIVGAIALAMGCGISNAQEFPRNVVFSTIVGGYCLAAVLGLAVGGRLTDVAAYHFNVVAVLMAAYGVFAIAIACVRAARPAGDSSDEGLLLDGASRRTGRGGAHSAGFAGQPGSGARDNDGHAGGGAQDMQVPIETRVELLAQRFVLTPRETQIVQILARGHGCAYVAETLLISKSTVYTHVRNVYRKLDVSSHDELIGKIYQQE